MTADTTPTLDARTRAAIDLIIRQLHQARAVARILEDEEICDGAPSNAAGAIVTVIDAALQTLDEIQGAAA